MRTRPSSVVFAVATTALLACPAWADKAHVKFVKLTKGETGWRVDTTVQHNDEGWEHYADWWRITDTDGKELARRALRHPHDAKPFTRSLRSVEFPAGLTQIVVEAHCLVHGCGGGSIAVDLTRPKGKEYEVIGLVESLPLEREEAADRVARPAAELSDAERLILTLDCSWDTTRQFLAQDAYKELKEMGNAAVPICLKAISTGNASARMWAGAVLAEIGGAEHLEALLKLLQDAHPKVRMIVAFHTRRFLDADERVPPALGARLSDPDPDVRKQATAALCKELPPTALPQVRMALDNSDRTIRSEALRMLLRYEKKNATQEMPKIVQSDAKGLVRSAAVVNLPTGGKSAKETFDTVLLLLDDGDALVREAALDVLTALLKKAPFEQEELNEVVRQCREKVPPLAKDQSPEVRVAALPLVAYLRREKALPGLAAMLQSDPSASVRKAVVGTLYRTKIKDRRLVDPLIAALSDQSPEVRAAALRMLGALHKKGELASSAGQTVQTELRARAAALLADESGEVRATAAPMVAGILGDAVADQLLTILKTDDSPAARRNAIVGLLVSKRRTSEVILAVLGALADPDLDVTATAAKTARRLFTKDDLAEESSPKLVAAVEKLEELAKHTDPDVRVRAMPLLGFYGRAKAAATLLAALTGDDDCLARAAAAEGLGRGRLVQQEVMDAIVRGLSDDYAGVREMCAKIFSWATRQKVKFNPKGEEEQRKKEAAEIEAWWNENRGTYEPRE